MIFVSHCLQGRGRIPYHLLAPLRSFSSPLTLLFHLFFSVHSFGSSPHSQPFQADPSLCLDLFPIQSLRFCLICPSSILASATALSQLVHFTFAKSIHHASRLQLFVPSLDLTLFPLFLFRCATVLLGLLRVATTLPMHIVI